MMIGRVRGVLVTALALLITTAGRGSAQLSPDIKWQTLRTEHFEIHFSAGLEEHARRAAVNAEHAYAQLATELVPPRGPLDLVIADNVDFTNGYATVFPTNRITIYAHPPTSQSALRFYDEWSALVITHELTHIFHLDRSRGWWRLAQRIFGRSPPLMPNLYDPSWLSEGLAVYYESRLTGSGRLVGSEHGMIARASAIAGTGRRLDELSLATSRYPEGQSAYVYGSLLFDYLSRTRGPEGVPRFIERISAAPIPFFLNRAARRSFGVTLEGAWRGFQDSLRREVSTVGPPMPGWRELTSAGRDVQHPRWLNDTTLVYAANNGRETAGAYRIDLNGHTHRIGRRTGIESNTPLADGSLLFAQLEYLDPYRVRSDLWIEKDGRQRRITRNARLSSPDARADGMIVAVQAAPGTTRLVIVTPDGRTITPLTTAAPDTQWTEPRWSPDGQRIVAVRRSRDGYSEIQVMREGGAPISLSRSWSVEASPSWSRDGRMIFFSSDRTGSTQLYAVSVDGDVRHTPRLQSEAATGIVDPEPAPSSAVLASILFRADGYHLGVAPLAIPETAPPFVADSATPARPAIGPLVLDTSAARPYRPWRTLVPRYWLPTIEETGDNELAYGAITSGGDVIGRHAFNASLQITPASADLSGGIGYAYAGFGNPVIDVSFSQFSDYDALRRTGNTAIVGYLRERTQLVSLAARLVRPRFRSSSSVTIGAELERATFTTRPANLLSQINADLSARRYAAAVVGAGWSNTQRPGLAISPEDGLAISGSARRRWRQDGGAGTTILVGSTRAYRSLNLPGFAHHVLAARVAGAWASDNSTSDFSVGGTSGSSLEIVPGLSIGDSPRTFGVRGFPSGSRDGIRAVGGTFEYRAPLVIPARGFHLLPLFFDKISFSAFADAGAAWCPARTPTPISCVGSLVERDWIASAGGEINLDAALPYDVPYRFRLGVAAPIDRGGLGGIDPVTVYFTLGYSF